MDTLNADKAADYVRAELARMGHTSIEIWDARREVEDGRLRYYVDAECVVEGARESTEVMACEWVVWQEPDGQIMGEWG